MKYPPHLLKLIDSLKRLPGVGSKSAERFAFQMLTWPHAKLEEISKIIKEIPDRLKHCPECGCLIGEITCSFCFQEKQHNTICLIAAPQDAFAIEGTREYKGLYHVLGGVLSPIDGFDASRLTLPKLKERIARLHVKELVIALDSTLEGDTTALYIKQELEHLPIKITRLAFGLPIGSSLNYVDGGTLARAFAGRNQF